MADIQEALQQITSDLRTIVRGEIELAKSEVLPGAKKAGLGAGLLAGAGVFALLGAHVLILCVGFLFTALFWGHVGPVAAFGLGFLCAAVLWLIIAGVLALIGYRNVKKLRKPEAAMAEAEASGKALSNAASRGLANVRMIATRGKKVITRDAAGQIVTVYSGPRRLADAPDDRTA